MINPVDRQHAEQILAWAEGRLRAAFRQFLNDTRSNRTVAEIHAHISSSNISAALQILDEHIAAFASAVPMVFVQVAHAETAMLAPRAVRHARRAEQLQKAVPTTVSFDPGDAYTAALMRAARLRFIQGFTVQQRAATRQALANAFARGASVLDATRAFRDSIGLTPSQLDAVESYRASLEQNSIDALRRMIRDRRFDPSVQNALDSGNPLDPDQIDRMVDRYQERYVQYRAETIARTEALSIVSQARQESMRQIMDQTGVESDRVQRTWVATKDKRTRDSHRAMDGQQVGLDEPFRSGLGNDLMYPGDPSAPPGDRINCRCTVVTTILPPSNLQVAA